MSVKTERKDFPILWVDEGYYMKTIKEGLVEDFGFVIGSLSTNFDLTDKERQEMVLKALEGKKVLLIHIGSTAAREHIVKLLKKVKDEIGVVIVAVTTELVHERWNKEQLKPIDEFLYIEKADVNSIQDLLDSINDKETAAGR